MAQIKLGDSEAHLAPFQNACVFRWVPKLNLEPRALMGCFTFHWVSTEFGFCECCIEQ